MKQPAHFSTKQAAQQLEHLADDRLVTEATHEVVHDHAEQMVPPAMRAKATAVSMRNSPSPSSAAIQDRLRGAVALR